MCDLLDVTCKAAEQVASNAFDRIALAAAQAAGEMIGQALTWWVQTDSIDPNTSTVQNLQSYTMPVVGLILVGSVLVQALRMVVTRKKDPLVNIASGLIRYAATVGVGLLLIGMCLKAGDDFSRYLINQTVPEFANRMKGLFAVEVLRNPFLLLMMALVACLLAAIQWALGFVRQAGLLVLAVLLPLAASGSINESTKVWLNRLIPWIVALVAYKPMAALIYAIGFSMLGTGQDLSTVLVGIVVLALAVIAMPAMLRFFGWMHVSSSGGGVGAAVASGAMGALALSQLASRGNGGAVQSASAMERSGPGSAGGAPGGPPPSPTSPGGGSGPNVPSGSGGAPTGASSPSGAAPTGAAAGGAAAGGAAGGGAPAAAPAGAGAGAGSAAAAAGPAGAATAAAAHVARGAYQASQSVADQATDGGRQQ